MRGAVLSVNVREHGRIEMSENGAETLRLYELTT